MPRGTLHLGTSGFAYPEWKGHFYPPDIRSDTMLAYYAEHFSSVEINYTFQRAPSETTLAKWVADTPESFAFSPKAHRRITHIGRLGDVAEPTAAFLRSLEPLGERLGAVLFQCPPTLAIDVQRLEAFLALLPDGPRFAFEFRHHSWNAPEVKDALSARGAAWCVADADEAEAPLERTAPGFVYLRLRKSIYDAGALAGWASAIGAALAEGADVYCYFKHEDSGRGIDFARMLQALIGDADRDVPGEALRAAEN